MKVSQLIECLEGFEPDMIVAIDGHYERYDLYEIGQVQRLFDAKRIKETIGGDHVAVVVIG